MDDDFQEYSIIACEAAVKYCTKAASLGEPWTKFNQMTERHEFLFFRVKRTEFFTKEWTRRKEYLQNGMEED